MSESLEEYPTITGIVPSSNDLHACEVQNSETHVELLTSIASKLAHASPKNLSLPKKPSSPCGVKHLNDLKVELVNEPLWKLFHAEQHEMKITNVGRSIFPVLQLRFSGLSSSEEYGVSVRFANVDSVRYRFFPTANEWLPWSTTNPDMTTNARRCYEHPSSPSLGTFWTTGLVSFDKLRLTNNLAKTDKHMINVSSLRKYRIEVIVSKIICSHCEQPHRRLVELPLCDFIAVTGYRNKKITQLKIEKNPFSVAFREKKTSRKRKSEQNLTNKKPRIDGVAMSEPQSRVKCVTSSPGSAPSIDLTDHVSTFLRNDVILYPQFQQALYPCGMEQLPDISQLPYIPDISSEYPMKTLPDFQPYEQYTYDYGHHESNQSYFYDIENFVPSAFQNTEWNTNIREATI